MGLKVFISKGSTVSFEQGQLVDAIIATLKTLGLSPRIMNENEFSYEQPLKAIKKVIRECDGAVIIAFTRTIILNGLEIKNDQKNIIENISLPTTWNHIEGSIAYTFDMPLLVIAEDVLKNEGLIDNKYDWSVFWTNINPDIVKSENFIGFIKSWKSAVEEYSMKRNNYSNKSFDVENLKLSTILKSLTIKQFWGFIASIISVIISIATISYCIGAGKWPWS